MTDKNTNNNYNIDYFDRLLNIQSDSIKNQSEQIKCTALLTEELRDTKGTVLHKLDDVKESCSKSSEADKKALFRLIYFQSGLVMVLSGVQAEYMTGIFGNILKWLF